MRIRVETSSGMPITRQIAAQIRAQCASGSLKPGDRLPSVRVLAAELSVNQNTVLRVYERLTAEGLLQRRHGDGTFVADRVPGGQMESQRRVLHQQIGKTVELAKLLGVDWAELDELIREAFDAPASQGPPNDDPTKQKSSEEFSS
ncbi:MAG: GntR family transcriptional regulator [Planctomycetaceae bacterium]|nr:GntR family transcriptional regulator [Planctomycetaceae bacterium]